MAMKSNVSYLTGKAKQDEIDSWNELGKMYDFAIKVTKKAYMPNSERQKQYLAILDEITASNDYLLLRIRYLTTKNKADKLVAALARFQHRVGENAAASYNRWRDSANEAGQGRSIGSYAQLVLNRSYRLRSLFIVIVGNRIVNLWRQCS
jgi:hypothetical protein